MQVNGCAGVAGMEHKHNWQWGKRLLFAVVLLIAFESPMGLPCHSQSQASSSASSQAGLEAPGYIGRRRRGRRGFFRRQVNQANRLAAQQQAQKTRELARQRQRGDQAQIKHEQALAKAKKSDFVKEYGGSRKRVSRKKRKSN